MPCCLMKENCHNSRTSHDTDMKLGPVAKFARRNTVALKKFEDDSISANFDVIFIFSIYDQFGAI